MNEALRQTLLKLQQKDHDTRTRLVNEGTLFEGYNETMAAVHEENARQLEGIIEQWGWPGHSLVGEDGAHAAWLISQHAISQPAFQRKCLKLIREAVQKGEMLKKAEAYLTDRICFNERRPQVYGTIFDWDQDGNLNPWTIEQEGGVDIRREIAGLPSLEQTIQEMQTQAKKEGNTPPTNYQTRQQEIEQWAKKVGWIAE